MSDINTLLSERKERVHEQNLLIKQYRAIKNQDDEKIIKKIKKQYSELREAIYDVEDKIAEISPEKLDDIVEPNPEDIDDAIHLFTDAEWDNIN